MREDTVGDGIMSELHREEEFAAERFAGALESAERGHALDARDIEDVELAPMVAAAALLRRTWNAITPDPDYFTRSRSTVLAAMSQRTEEPVAPLSFIERLRRSPVFASVASAAAAGFAAVVITLQFAGGGTVAPLPLATNIVEPAALDSVTEEVAGVEVIPDLDLPGADPALSPFTPMERASVDAVVAEIIALAERGEVVTPDVLRRLTSDAVRVSAWIATQAETGDSAAVLSQIQIASTGHVALQTIKTTGGNQRALETAQSATRDLLITGARYFVAAQAAGNQ